MHTKLASAVLLTALLGLASASFAATMTTSGTIKLIDAKAMTVTMLDGSVYTLPQGFKVADFKTGEKVTLGWEQKGTVRAIDTMTAS